MTQEDRDALFEQISNLHGSLEKTAEKLFHSNDPLMLAIHEHTSIEMWMLDQIDAHIAGVQDVLTSWEQTVKRYQELLTT